MLRVPRWISAPTCIPAPNAKRAPSDSSAWSFRTADCKIIHTALVKYCGGETTRRIRILIYTTVGISELLGLRQRHSGSERKRRQVRCIVLSRHIRRKVQGVRRQRELSLLSYITFGCHISFPIHGASGVKIESKIIRESFVSGRLQAISPPEAELKLRTIHPPRK
jgi:hypothetical protein